MRPRRLVNRRQVRLSRKQQRDDTHPMSLFSSRGMAPDGCLIGCPCCFLLILTCPIQTRPELESCLRTGVSSWFSVDRALLSQRVPAVWPDDGLRPAIPSHQLLTQPNVGSCRLSAVRTPHAPDPQVWSSRTGGKIPDRQRPPVHTCSYLTSSPTAL